MFAALSLPPLPGRRVERRAQLLAVAHEFSPRVERFGIAGGRQTAAGRAAVGSGQSAAGSRQMELLALDVTGLGRWFEHPRALGDALRRAAADRGLAAHVAVAATRTAAVLLACGRAGLTVSLPGEEAARLAGLPLSVLDAWRPSSRPTVDPSPSPCTTLRRWGLKTLGDLAGLPAVELSERLGQVGVMWQRLARGEDLEPLVPVRPDEPFEESIALEWPIDRLEPLSFVLGRLFDNLSTRLEHADRGVAVLHVRLDLVGREHVVRTLQLPAPMRDPRTLRTLALLDLESNPPPAAVDRVTVAADVVEGRVLQCSLLRRALPADRLSTLLARLSALMGADRVGAPALVDSHRPGAFAMEAFEADSRQPTAVSQGPTAGSSVVSIARSPLASRLSPDVIRRFRRPIPAHVDVDRGRPVRVGSDRRHVRGGAVEVCAGPWRSSGHWWATCLEHWDRDEWDVALRDGARYVIFYDRQRDRWFIDGMLD